MPLLLLQLLIISNPNTSDAAVDDFLVAFAGSAADAAASSGVDVAVSACACVCVLKLHGSSSTPNYGSFSGSSSIPYSRIDSRSPSVPLSLAASLPPSKSKRRLPPKTAK